MNLTQKVALDPTQKQIKSFEKAVRAARWAYNWGRETWPKMLEEYKADPKNKLPPNGRRIRAKFNEIKGRDFPWVTEVTKWATAIALENLAEGYDRFFKKVSKYPKFKSARRAPKSFGIGDQIGKIYGTRIQIPRVGKVKYKGQLRWPYKVVVRATVICNANKWFLCITYDDSLFPKDKKFSAEKQRTKESNDRIIGVDVGITNPYTYTVKSNGSYLTEHKSAPRPLKKYQKRLRIAQRRLTKKKIGSRNRERAKKHLAHLHWRISNQRRDAIHKFTKKICSENEAIVIETLNVKGMMRGNLAQSLSDLSFFKFRRQVQYKTLLYGNKLVPLDRWFPSSKLCSNCGVKHEKFEREPIFKCPTCGFEAPRDDNASKNMVIEGERQLALQAEAAKATEAGTCGSQGTVSLEG